MSSTFKRPLVAACLIAAGTLAYAAPAAAQATRTWVSGVGDDVNPCSRTAPCKTFAGAISKTAAGGEINCLDQGAYGAVTITKSIALVCVGVTAGVLHSATNGIIINAAATDVIFLKGLDINGGTPSAGGLNGIRFLAGASLTVEDTLIRNSIGAAPNGFGISFVPSGASKLVVKNSTISNHGTASSGAGILIQPTGAGGSAVVTLDGVSLNNNPAGGFKIDTTGNTSPAGVKATIINSDISANGGGIAAVVPGGTSSVSLMIASSNVSNNGAGIIANGAAATVRVGNTVITGNGNGLVVAAGASILSFGNNLLQGNTTNGAFTGTVPTS